MSASIERGRQVAVLRAQARSLKKAWRRGQVRSRQLVEQLLQQLSLSNSSSSSRNNNRLINPPTCCSMQSQLHYGPRGGAGDDNQNQINDDVGYPTADAGADDLDSLQIRPANFLMSLASCCFKVHNLSYQTLIDDSNTLVDGSLSQDNCSTSSCYDSNATVVLKVSILGDSNTGKTSFMAKYVCPRGELSQELVETMGVATEEKVVHVKSGARIAFNIWDLGGHWQCGSMVPLVCRDAAAILIMFDLTRRSTLNSVMDWFTQARDCNKAAMTVMIGTKYDHFVELPQNIQLAIVEQARVYAKAMGAPLFFSSVSHNINVHKVFKVIVAKLFDLPCPVPINLNLGEPLVDY